MLTQKRLKEILHYEPETGVFSRVNSKRKKTGYVMTKGYIQISVNGRGMLAHRLAWLYMTGEWPEDQIDHINHVRDDNRWINIRSIQGKQNQKNMKKAKNNRSGITGVFWNNDKGKWTAKIESNKKKINLGNHLSIFDAACARKSAELKYGFHENHGR